MAAADQPGHGGSLGPIGQMIEDYHAYSDAIRTSHETHPEKETDLLAKVKAAYPGIDWAKPAYLEEEEEHVPEGGEQEEQEPISERIYGRA